MNGATTMTEDVQDIARDVRWWVLPIDNDVRAVDLNLIPCVWLLIELLNRLS